jgi:hypothetical protein
MARKAQDGFSIMRGKKMGVKRRIICIKQILLSFPQFLSVGVLILHEVQKCTLLIEDANTNVKFRDRDLSRLNFLKVLRLTLIETEFVKRCRD